MAVERRGLGALAGGAALRLPVVVCEAEQLVDASAQTSESSPPYNAPEASIWCVPDGRSRPRLSGASLQCQSSTATVQSPVISGEVSLAKETLRMRCQLVYQMQHRA
ncbi:hypothetical protein BU23DRAFT_80966 [Bimuria novae-zelandiae CBS 107.79]|uniref:Uncharacterized protein n=1 Tax=Bimuria novae-zelandiae CBS 107.79 TaxID=1447943 RepID=A0A6A5VFT8_9PLEO|nr:hypothetical protein BU23DRAFT_80966 [Bimuria novae-zelandiae CBS 107.79]